MKMIVGLGNPGKKYETTRHNVGFITLDLLAEFMNTDLTQNRFNGLYNEVFFGGEKIILVKPQTYMNLSGQCIGEFARYYKIENDEILVIADDLSLPTGTMKLRPKGSSGGHNGLKSLIAHLEGEDFPRLKIGIGRGREGDVVDHVLGVIGEKEWEIMVKMMKTARDCSLEWLKNGIDDAMCKYNQYAKLPKAKRDNKEKDASAALEEHSIEKESE